MNTTTKYMFFLLVITLMVPSFAPQQPVGDDSGQSSDSGSTGEYVGLGVGAAAGVGALTGLARSSFFKTAAPKKPEDSKKTRVETRQKPTLLGRKAEHEAAEARQGTHQGETGFKQQTKRGTHKSKSLSKKGLGESKRVARHSL